jgi:hypothetical protein
MRIPSVATPDFWKRYERLPLAIQALARKNYNLWRADAFHPSLHFKRIGNRNWSARVGDHYRAVGVFSVDVFVGQWIGTHEEFNKQFR